MMYYYCRKCEVLIEPSEVKQLKNKFYHSLAEAHSVAGNKMTIDHEVIPEP